MTFKRAIPKCTPEQQARQDKCREMGCIACRMEREWGSSNPLTCGWPEIHHLTQSGRQLGQEKTVCLGQWHHRALCFSSNPKSSDMFDAFGPSLAKGSKPFHARYGNNEELLDYQNKLIKDNSC